MSEEVKKAINMLEIFISNHKFYNIKHSDGLEDNIEIILELIRKQQVKINAQQCLIETQIYNVEVLEKELNNLKEIEKSHQEENGKLRVELEQEKASNKFDKGLYGLLMKEKERNKELEKKLKIAKQIYNDVCVCIATECVEKDKIKEKIELLKDILKAKEKDGNIYKQIPIEYLKGAIEQLEELLEEK